MTHTSSKAKGEGGGVQKDPRREVHVQMAGTQNHTAPSPRRQPVRNHLSRRFFVALFTATVSCGSKGVWPVRLHCYSRRWVVPIFPWNAESCATQKETYQKYLLFVLFLSPWLLCTHLKPSPRRGIRARCLYRSGAQSNTASIGRCVFRGSSMLCSIEILFILLHIKRKRYQGG